jgi:hypothetical protein
MAKRIQYHIPKEHDIVTILIMNTEINIFTVLEKDLMNVSERKLPI